jgi:hypothetical protein
VDLLVDRLRIGLHERFEQALATKRYSPADLGAGREHVRAYVSFLHFAEGLYDAAGQSAYAPAQDAEHAHDRKERQAMHEHESPAQPNTPRVPSALKKEHEELHAELVRATRLTGPVGDAARAVVQVLHPHFVKEEEFALPALGLLSAAAEGKLMPEMRSVLPLTDRLRRELPQMLAEHQAIVAALKKLSEAAHAASQDDVVALAEKLTLHAQAEEQVMYPAAILVGEYLKLRIGA